MGSVNLSCVFSCQSNTLKLYYLQLKKFAEWTTMFLNLETGQLVAVGSVLGNAYQSWSTQRGLNIYSTYT